MEARPQAFIQAFDASQVKAQIAVYIDGAAKGREYGYQDYSCSNEYREQGAVAAAAGRARILLYYISAFSIMHVCFLSLS